MKCTSLPMNLASHAIEKRIPDSIAKKGVSAKNIIDNISDIKDRISKSENKVLNICIFSLCNKNR